MEQISDIRPRELESIEEKVLAFINMRPEYVTALRNTPGNADQTDYHRWSGHAEARRQLAGLLGLTVPHEPGTVAKPIDKEEDIR